MPKEIDEDDLEEHQWTKKQKDEYTPNSKVDYHILSVLPIHK